MVAQVVPALALPRSTPVFDYLVPADSAGQVRPGQIVRLPFRRRTVLGVVWSVAATSQIPREKLRPLAPLPGRPVFCPEPQRAFLDWLAGRAGVSPGLIIKTSLRSSRALDSWPRWPERRAPGQHDLRVVIYEREPEGRAALTTLLAGANGPVALVVPETTSLEAVQPLLPRSAVVWRAAAPPAQRRANLAALTTAPIIVGTRSLLTTPLPPLARLILWAQDSPHHDQRDQQPRFNGWVAALELARRSDCPLVALSPAPTLTAYAASQSAGRWETLAATAPCAVTLWTEARPGLQTLPAGLVGLVQRALGQGERTFLFLNRRGVAHRLRCPTCAWLARCDRCGTPVVLHDRRLDCHTCGLSRPAPAACPECREPDLETSIPGTAGLERELAARFPGAVARLDRDAPQASSAPILVGTEFALPRLTEFAPDHVVVLGLDAAFAASTPWALERAWQLLRRLAAVEAVRSIAVLTRQPNQALLQAFVQHRPELFYQTELAARQRYGWPPVTVARAFEARTAATDAADLFRWLGTRGVPASAVEGPVLVRRGRRTVARYRLRGPTAERLEGALTDLPESWIIEPDPLD